ncbi:PREDICTED: checkpoint protein HUS1-like [Dipodomys ordii]|uniref:Checkpoint protein n=1 Tax=Dipodomys ordii TaxID=10020 RepID=A0A1S3GQU9_DIPOR|nr:PREDICTED: checkpoint protein HUS1-like [Dipodomys ordii]
MRFRAEIVDQDSLGHFKRVIRMLAKLAKGCILHICPDKLSFILLGSQESGRASLWCELLKENFFSKFQMKGVSAEYNEIYLQLQLENLTPALNNSHSTEILKIKFINKYSGIFKICIKLLCESNRSCIMTYYFPIEVIPTHLWNKLQEPIVPNLDVSIYLPILKTLKNVVEKMKHVSNYLIIEANQNGELNLKMENELVSVTTYFQDLGNPRLVPENASEDRQPEEKAEMHINVYQLLHFLGGVQDNPTKATFNMVRNRISYFEFLFEIYSVKYFIPALN